MGKYSEDNLVGRKFGRLLITGAFDKAPPSLRKYECLCECGETTHVAATSLVRGATTSCGCLRKELATRHGHSREGKCTPTYQSWVAMVARCTNPSSGAYHYYGGAGVRVCARWLESFEAFLLDMGQRPDGTSIDRIDGAKLYSKGTCRWATKAEQQRNRAVTIFVQYEGKEVTLKELEAATGVLYVTLRGRYMRGLSGADLTNASNLKRMATKHQLQRNEYGN